MLDYLDEDVGYLLGLITVRGRLLDTPPVRNLVIEFPFKNLIVGGVSVTYNRSVQLQLGSNEIRDRMTELLGTTVEVQRASKSVIITARFLQDSIVWRDLRMLCGNSTAYTSSFVPTEIFESTTSIKKEFMRGVADASGGIARGTYIRDKDKGKRRVFIAVDNRNWHLPVQLCALLQDHLGIPVGEILWGHPNMRDPSCHHPKKPEGREHQIRIFSEAFEPIGFNLPYKDEILSEFIEDDRSSRVLGTVRYCDPCAKKVRRGTEKAPHPQEQANRLPSELKGKHYDSYWQICLDMGCRQCHSSSVEAR